jgi:hypothetical protein
MSSVFDANGYAQILYSKCESAWNNTLTNDPKYFENKLVSECHIWVPTTSSMPITTNMMVSNTTHGTVSNTTHGMVSNTTHGCSVSGICTRTTSVRTSPACSSFTQHSWALIHLVIIIFALIQY